MKTLEQFKDEIANKYGFDNWGNISKTELFRFEIDDLNAVLIGYDDMFDEACELYTTQEVKKHLAIAAEKSLIRLNGEYVDSVFVDDGYIDKESITSIKIELTKI